MSTFLIGLLKTIATVRPHALSGKVTSYSARLNVRMAEGT
jgi:hypothetical protein